MSMPPPPPGNSPPPYQPGSQPPVGYQPYGGPNDAKQQGYNGLSIASLVLSLVNVIPCFWVFPLPALLGIIFGVVGRGQIKRTGAKGSGMAIAGLVIGIVFIIIGIAFWAYIATSDNCYRDGSSFHCTTTN